MRSKTIENQINVPKEQVWTILTDISGLANWVPTQRILSISEPDNIGLGTQFKVNSFRQPKGETSFGATIESFEIVSWEEGQSIGLNLIGGRDAVKLLHYHWSLQSDENFTRVSLTSNYEMRGGELGFILAKIMVDRLLQNVMTEMVANLKQFAETGEKIPKPRWMPDDNTNYPRYSK